MNIFTKLKLRQEAHYKTKKMVFQCFIQEAKYFRKQQVRRSKIASLKPLNNPFEIAIKQDGKIVDDQYASHLYCAIENSGIYDLHGDLVAHYGQRSCARMIAILRGKGCYLDFVWDTTSADLQYIHDDIKRLGYQVGEYPAYHKDFEWNSQVQNYVKKDKVSV